MITKEQYFELVKCQALVYCQLYIFSPEDKELLNPIIFGSGFFVSYKGNFFLVTADHNLHFDDYDKKEERTGREYIVAIINNVNKDLTTVLTPLGGFYYAEQLSVDKNTVNLVDISVCLLKDINFKQPFLTHEISINDNSQIIIPAKLEKKFYDATQFDSPDINQKYSIYSVIHNDINGIKGIRANALFSDISYSSTHSNNHIFIFPNEVNEDLRGMSGSPIFDYKGNIVGVINRINGQGIWATPIEYATMLMDLAIKNE